MRILTIRVLDGQREQLKKIADLKGFATVSEWFRDYIRKETKKMEEGEKCEN